MPDKPRTPPPPRRVQAPKKRGHAPRPIDPDRRRFYYLIAAAASGLIGLAVAVAVILSSGGGGGGGVKAALEAAGCTYTESPALPGRHMTTPTEKVKYKTFPPSSGTHNPQPAVWGNYDQPVDPRQAVHNLEHGGVVIWYGEKIAPAQRQQLTAFYDEAPNGLLVTPLAEKTAGVTFPKHEPLGARIALTAWPAKVNEATGDIKEAKGAVAICPRVSLKAFEKFRDAFRGKGPERFPVSQLQPGS